MAHVRSVHDMNVEQMESQDAWKQEAEKDTELLDFGHFMENVGLDVASAFFANKLALKICLRVSGNYYTSPLYAPPICPVCHRVGVSIFCQEGQGTELVNL